MSVGVAVLGGRGLVPRQGLFEVLNRSVSGRVTVVSAPAGSGKTLLLRSWIDHGELARRVAWVSVERAEEDAQRFWSSVVEALRAAVDGDASVEKPTASPEFDGGAVVERLVSDLASLDQRVVLVIDDLHELRSADALAQLQLLLTRLPPALHVVLATRHDPHLGLHRLRLAGELTEIRAADLRFTLQEARKLLDAAGIALTEASVAVLHERDRRQPPGCGWRRSRSRGIPSPSASSPSSPAASAPSPITCSRRCSIASPRTCGTCCSAPRCWSG